MREGEHCARRRVEQEHQNGPRLGVCLVHRVEGDGHCGQPQVEQVLPTECCGHQEGQGEEHDQKQMKGMLLGESHGLQSEEGAELDRLHPEGEKDVLPMSVPVDLIDHLHETEGEKVYRRGVHLCPVDLEARVGAY